MGIEQLLTELPGSKRARPRDRHAVILRDQLPACIQQMGEDFSIQRGVIGKRAPDEDEVKPTPTHRPQPFQFGHLTEACTDRALVLQKGLVVLAGAAAELRHSEQLASFLGV